MNDSQCSIHKRCKSHSVRLCCSYNQRRMPAGKTLQQRETLMITVRAFNVMRLVLGTLSALLDGVFGPLAIHFLRKIVRSAKNLLLLARPADLPENHLLQ